jgi:hypothetical protein
MESLTATSKSVVGMPREHAWAQAFSLGDLFGVLSIYGREVVVPSDAGRNILEELEREYGGLPKKNLASIGIMFNSILEKNASLEISLLLAVRVGRVLYLFNRGGGLALLSRGGRQVVILESNDKSASGILEPFDTLILFTKGFLDLISIEKVRQELDYSSLDAIYDFLTPMISEKIDNSLAASLICGFEEEKFSDSYVSVSSPPEVVKLSRLGFLSTAREGLQQKGYYLFSPLVRKMSSFFSLIFQVFQKRFPKRDFYVRQYEERKNHVFLRSESGVSNKSSRTLLTVGMLLVILLGVTAFLGVQKRRTEENLANFNNLYNLSETKYTDGKALLGLNPVRARTLLGDSKKAAEEAKTAAVGDKTALKKAEKLLQNIDEALEGISGIYRLADVPVFFDLTVVSAKGMGRRLSLNNRKLAILDSVNNSVYMMGAGEKNAEVIAGGAENFTNSRFISLHGDFAYVLSDKGITEIDASAKTNKLVVKKDEGWGEIGAMSEYGAFRGSIYLLDKNNSRIIKYVSTESGFSATKDYLASDIKPNFSQAASMVIDGSIWILFSDGKISRYTSGKPDFFNLTGLDVNFISPTVLYTDEDCKNLYILDSGNKRIVVIDKDKKLGEYVSQYVWDGLGAASDFVVDEGNRKIYVLSGGKVFSIDLK